jgi:hypothetical protein
LHFWNSEKANRRSAQKDRAMKNLITRTKLIAVLAITTLFVVIGVLNLRDRLSAPAIADDGV